MFFARPGFLYGSVMSLEGLRRGQTGSAMMAAFVDLEAEGFANMAIHFQHIELMCEIIERILLAIPPPFIVYCFPFIDYATGCRCFVTTLGETIKNIPIPADSCFPYWPKIINNTSP